MPKYLLNPDLPKIKPDFKGNIYKNGHFEANGMTINASFLKVLKWQLSNNPQKEEKEQDEFKLKLIRGRSFLHGEKDVLVWLGHASFFIRMNGISMITDPCLKDLPLVKRKIGLPCSIKEFIGIDYLLLSHAHPDHYDTSSVNQLIEQNPKMELLLPLKISDLLGNNRKRIKYQEAGWWQQFKVEGLDVFFLPAKHWSRRGLFDFNKNLWGSFLIKNDKRSIYFAGDSGYANHFKEIREITGAPDICILPVGTYKPPSLMQESHLSPQEAVEAFHELQGKILIPMHYGTYDLSDEPIGEPARMLQNYQQQGKIKGELKMPDVGEIVKLL